MVQGIKRIWRAMFPELPDEWEMGRAHERIVHGIEAMKTKVAALESERDELKRANEDMAARLRAVKDSLNHERNVETMVDFRICRLALLDLVTALDGPVPECRACAEKRAIALEILDIFTQERALPHKVADKIDAMHRIEDRARRILARHAAEGGDHE